MMMPETKNILWLKRDEQGVARDEYGHHVTVVTSDGRNTPSYVKIPKEAQRTAGVSSANNAPYVKEMLYTTKQTLASMSQYVKITKPPTFGTRRTTNV